MKKNATEVLRIFCNVYYGPKGHTNFKGDLNYEDC